MSRQKFNDFTKVSQPEDLISSTVGAATRRQMQRDRSGSMTLQALLHTIMKRHAEVYFSIVRRRAACVRTVILTTCDENTNAVTCRYAAKFKPGHLETSCQLHSTR